MRAFSRRRFHGIGRGAGDNTDDDSGAHMSEEHGVRSYRQQHGAKRDETGGTQPFGADLYPMHDGFYTVSSTAEKCADDRSGRGLAGEIRIPPYAAGSNDRD